MRKSILTINNLHKGVTENDFNNNFDFINQNYDNLTDDDNNKDYVKVKYLKGKGAVEGRTFASEAGHEPDAISIADSEEYDESSGDESDVSEYLRELGIVSDSESSGDEFDATLN